MTSPKTPLEPRKRPKQARAQETVDCILAGAARVFRREGWDATTNRIAEAAGVSIGTLYEWFPNKDALLFALAERHVEVAERELDAALDETRPTRDLFTRIQRAILESQRFPSEALALVCDVGRVGSALQERAERLRARTIAEIATRVRRDRPDVADPMARARACFGALGDLTVRALLESPDDDAALAAELLEMAVGHARTPPREG